MLYCAVSGAWLWGVPSRTFSFPSILLMFAVAYLRSRCWGSHRQQKAEYALEAHTLLFCYGAAHAPRRARSAPMFSTHSNVCLMFYQETTVPNARPSAHTLLSSPFATKNTALKPFGLFSPVFSHSLRTRKRSRSGSRVFR